MSRSMWVACLAAWGLWAWAAPARPAGSKPPATAPKTPPSRLTVEALGADFRPLVRKTPAGRIDWTRGQIVAAGIGRARGASAQDAAMAKRAARLVAARNAILLMTGVEAGPAGRFGDIRKGQLTAEGVLKDFKEVSVAFDPGTRTATATLRVPIHGAKGMVAMRHVILGLPLRRWRPPRARKPAAKIDAVVIDARGSGFVPCVYPRLITPEGRFVLDGVYLRRDDPTRVNRPLYVAYAPKSAKPTTRPAKLPKVLTFGRDRRRAIVLRAVRVSRKPAGLVLDAADVERLGRHPGVERLLELGEVAIVVDRVPAGKSR